MITTLTGTNSFALRKRLNELIASFVEEFGELAFERLDGEEIELNQLVEAIQSVPFLASRKMVILRSPGSNKSISENIEQVLSSVAESTDFIIYEPHIDKRTGYYKTLKLRANLQEFNELDEHGLTSWLVATAKERGGVLTRADATFLVQRVGAEQQLLASELEKLLIYDPVVSRESIELLTESTPQSKIFDLLDAAFSGNVARAMTLYDEQRAQRVEPQQILAMLGWQLHLLVLVKAAGSRSAEEIAASAKLNPYVVRKTQAIAKKLSRTHIKELVSGALDIDVRSKTSALDIDEALKNYIVTAIKVN